jgi:pyruvate,water dikinase
MLNTHTPTVTTVSTFPESWDSIAVDGPPFEFDPMHSPFPVSPLMASTQGAFADGYTRALREANVPIRATQVRFVNHYRYVRMLPQAPSSDEEAAAQAALVEATLQQEIGRMLDRWYVEHRPRLAAMHERLREMDVRGAPRYEVLALLDEVDDLHRELWTIHFRIAVPMLLAMQIFSEFHADLFGEDGAAARTLMAGTPSESLKAAFGLSDLADRARALGLDGMITSLPVDDLPAALEATEEGEAFMAGLQAYLETYGYRQDLFDYTTATWREDPSIAPVTIRNYLLTGHDPRTEHEKTARTAQHAFEAARARLATYPGAVWEQFEQMAQHARQGAFLQEEHNFYIDQKGLSLLRLFYLEVGAHLRDRGVIAAADDVFLLRIEEVRELVAAQDGPLHAARARDLVVTRRAELAAAATMAPPPLIGDTTFAPPPDSVMTRAVTAFFGGPPQQAEAPGQLKGNPGSRGAISGVARVARTLEEAKAIQPGEILVALTTMPAWTPLFGIAAAVVTETGGALSHCAIVAREYGIPAVVGAHGATRAIATGQRITVDGDRGVVTIDA